MRTRTADIPAARAEAPAHGRVPGRPRRGGFTLIELLAVLLIIAVIGAALVPSLLSSSEAVETSSTRTLIAQISAEIEAYERGPEGDYPPSTFPGDLDPKPTTVNMGAEMLVIALLPADGSYRASESYEDALTNTDADVLKTSLTRFSNPSAFEFSDAWGNPIAYLHRRDYAQGGEYLSYSYVEDAWVEQVVTGEINPQTGDPRRPQTFQLISAGADGVFGTDDDIGNFKR